MSRKVCPTDVSDEKWVFLVSYLALIREDAGQRVHALLDVFGRRALDRSKLGAPGGCYLATFRLGKRSSSGLARFRRLSRDDERLPTTLVGLHWLAFACLLLSNWFKPIALSA